MSFTFPPGRNPNDTPNRARASFYTGRSDLLSDATAFEACMTARKDGASSLRTFADEVRL